MNEIENIINKWQILQVIIKEEITLSNIITEDQKVQLSQLKDCYYNYYNIKIQIDSQYKSNEFFISKSAESVLLEAYPIVNDIFMKFRQNDGFIIQLIDIIEKNDYIKDNNVNDIIQFFCNQFYEDILLSNNNEEHLFLIQKMIKREVNYLNGENELKPTNFLNEFSSFLGKYLKCYSANQEFISFFSMIVNEAIVKIKHNEKGFELNLSRLYDQTKKKFAFLTTDVSSTVKLRSSVIEGVDLHTLSHSIPRSGFARKINKINMNVMFKLDENTYVTPDITGLSNDYYYEEKMDNDDQDNKFIEDQINDSYTIELTSSHLKEIINNQQSPIELKEFCQRQLDFGGNYSNTAFLSTLKTYSSFAKQILDQYKVNFLFTKDIIDTILKNLDMNIDSIPFSLRWICKMISEEITAKKPNISLYERNAFIGEFLFRKCLTNFNIVKHQSQKTIESFNTLSKILNKISRFQLFSEELECQYTLFNRYIMEISPKLNEFFEKLIDVEITETSPSQFTCVIFNIEIVLYLYSIIKDHKEAFEDLPNGKIFSKSISKMVYQTKKLEKKVKKSKEKVFLTLFKYDSDFIEEITETNVQLNQIVTNSVTIEDKVKFCIKIILKRLNVINSKLYSHLNLADSNKNFLLALNEVIQLEEKKENSSSEDLSTIPLNWYSLFMASHLDNKNENTSDSDDYKKIYNDLLEEEQNYLINLKEKYNRNAIKIGLLLQCAQNKIEKTKMVLRQKRKDGLNMIAKKMIQEYKFPVCIIKADSSPKKKNSSQKKSFFSFSFKAKKTKEADKTTMTTDSLSSSYFQVTPISHCIHQGLNVNKEEKDSEGCKLYYHSETVKQFALNLSDFEEVQMDIKIGEQVYQTLQAINQFLTIVHQTINTQFTLSPNETGIVLELIEEEIIHHIYKKLSPTLVLDIDNSLKQKLESLCDLPPSKLNVHSEYINNTLLNLAVSGFNAIEKKTTPREKLKIIESTLNIIRNLMKFLGHVKKEDNIQIFEPILKYLLIQAKPSRLFADINFIKALSHSTELTQKYETMVDQLESAALFFTGKEENYFKDDKETE